MELVVSDHLFYCLKNLCVIPIEQEIENLSNFDKFVLCNLVASGDGKVFDEYIKRKPTIFGSNMRNVRNYTITILDYINRSTKIDGDNYIIDDDLKLVVEFFGDKFLTFLFSDGDIIKDRFGNIITGFPTYLESLSISRDIKLGKILN